MKVKLLVTILIGIFPMSGQSAQGANRSLSVIQSATLVRLLCFDNETKILRASNVKAGCTEDERSLGASALKYPAHRPTDLNPFLKARFLAAQSAGKKVGKSILLTSGYRSYVSQGILFKQAVKKYGSKLEASKNVLPADVSHHPWGMALDINYPNNPVDTKWLAINGYKYGLCLAYENEWWHFEGLSAPGQKCPKKLKDASTTEKE